VMGKNKVLVKVHPEGKYVVDIDKNIDITKCTPTVRVALRNDSYQVRISEHSSFCYESVLPSRISFSLQNLSVLFRQKLDKERHPEDCIHASCF
jgi:hypothetical protein